MVRQRSALTVNCHSDFLCHAIGSYRRCGDPAPLHQWQEKLTTGDVDAVFCAVGGDADTFPVAYSETRAYFEAANELCERFHEHFRVVRSAHELVKAGQDGRIGFFLGLEGCRALEGQLEALEDFYARGLRWLALTWNPANALADGIGETRHGGLTPFGKEVVRRANRLGIILDLVHSSRNTFYDAVAVCEAPFIVSHSNAAAICPHVRNLSDDQIRKVASTGGVIGINFFPRFLTEGKARWADIERHIRYIAALVGPESVALGPDFIDFSPEEIAHSLSESTIDYGEDCSYPPGFSDDSCFRDIDTRLSKACFEDDEIAGIMGSNILRVVEDVEQASTKG